MIYPRDPAFYTVAADVDVVRFAAPGPGTFVAEVLNVASGLGRMQMTVHDAAGTQVGSASYCTGSPISANNGTGNVCGRVQLTTSVAGIYFVRVEPFSATASGTYSLRVLPRYDQGLTWDAASEPNDVFALAPAITVGRGGAVNRVIHPLDPAFYTVAADVDLVRFAAPGPGTFVAEVLNVASGLGRMQMTVHDAAGTQVGSASYCTGSPITANNGSGNVCGRVQVTTSVAGTFFVRVEAFSETASGTYSLRVLPRYDQGLTWDREGEANDIISLAYPITVGIAQGHTISPLNGAFYTVAGENDMFRLPALAGRTYVIQTRDVSASLGQTNLHVFDAAGTQVVANANCLGGTGTVCNQVQFTTSLAGNHFLRVQPSVGTASGTYSICAPISTQATCSVSPLLNPGFELDANADGRPDSWTSDARFTRSAAIAPHNGTRSGRLFATDDSTITIAQTVANQPLAVPYRLSGWFNIPATTDTFSATLRIRWRDAAGALLGVTNVKTYRAATTGWNLATATITPPAGTNNAAVEINATSLNAAVYVDDVSFIATR